MIELNSKTQQDFLNREWVQRLLDVGVDMSDAKYYIARKQVIDKEEDVILLGLPSLVTTSLYACVIPTYTVSELLYKLHEWIYPTIDGIEYSGGLKMIKDAPFYICWYDLSAYVPNDKNPDKVMDYVSASEYIFAEAEYPIESLASLLIQCHKKDIGIATKDTGDISKK